MSVSHWGHTFVPGQFIGVLINRRKLYPTALHDTLPHTYQLRQAADYNRTVVECALRCGEPGCREASRVPVVMDQNMSDGRDVAVIGPAPSTAPGTGRGRCSLREGSLRGIVGLADAADFPDVPDDVSTNKHTYLADAYPDTNESK